MDGRNSRQSFLGPRSDAILGSATVGIVGLGGGGSHVAQQLAHVGLGNIALFDGDVMKDVNLNRVVGATEADVLLGRPKVEIAARVIRGVNSKARVTAHQAMWQHVPEALRSCDLLFGCVDGYAEREMLERSARRFLIPLIDIGLDVAPSINGEPPRMAGQVILSMPGHTCMRCMGFITEKKLGIEASQYGAAGGRPQVVWSNGVLASTAVGIPIDVLTDWSKTTRGPQYLSYDANLGLVARHPRLAHAPSVCTHFAAAEVGEPRLLPL
jgi:molybdopterin-synthase adenylyltransferase